jgi:predicted nuclease of predicted toxin-antitoxin system
VTKRVLLDESVPRHLAVALDGAGFSATPYPSSWKQTKNGELLELAERRGFDVLITSDKNIYAQQNLRGRTLSIIVLPTNLRRHVMERVADIVDTINRIESRQYVVIERSGRRLVLDYDVPGAAFADMPSVKPLDDD